MTTSTRDSDAPPSYWKVLTTRNVAPLLLSASLSRLASEMLLFAVVLFVLSEFDSPILAGLSGLFLTLPGFLISPLAGALLDRAGAVRAVVLDTIASATLIGFIVVASVGGWLSPALLLTVLGVYSLTSPLSAGGIRTLFPRFVPDVAYDKANALDLSAYSVIEVIGPLVAGGLIALIGPDPTLGVVAGTFALASLSLLPLRASGAEPPRPRREHLLREAWEGITYLVRNAYLRGLALSYSCYQVTFGILVVAVPVTVAERIGGTGPTEQVSGLMWSIVGLTGAGGALVAGKILSAGGERRMLVLTMLISSVAIFPVSALASLVTLAVGLGLFGLFEGALNVSVLSLRQRRTEPGWLGRVMTVSISVNLIGFPIGTALGGLVVTWSTTGAFAVAAGFALLAGAMGAVFIPGEPGTGNAGSPPAGDHGARRSGTDDPGPTTVREAV